jgi:hypothetical protein
MNLACMTRLRILLLALLGIGCAHRPLAGGDLDRVTKPAFLSWIEPSAGPKSTVFRDDEAYAKRLGRLDAGEADRRLQTRLERSVSRFEVSDRLRSTTFSKLPREVPWSNTIDPAMVATVLESFLVEEVPAKRPDVSQLKPLGADAVVEFVVQSYGMRSQNGHAGVYIEGYARMFFLNGGEIWKRSFHMDGIQMKRPHLDPFAVAKDPWLYRNEISALEDIATDLFARDLTPTGRRGGAPLKPGSDELSAPPDDTNRTGRQSDSLESE